MEIYPLGEEIKKKSDISFSWKGLNWSVEMDGDGEAAMAIWYRLKLVAATRWLIGLLVVLVLIMDLGVEIKVGFKGIWVSKWNWELRVRNEEDAVIFLLLT